MNNKFNIGDELIVMKFVGRVTDIRENINFDIYGPISYYRYEVTFCEDGNIGWFNEDDLKKVERGSEDFCEPLNNAVQNNTTRTCYYLGEKATFHRWVDETKMIVKFNSMMKPEKIKEAKEVYLNDGFVPGFADTIPLTTTFALIEVSDGSVKKVLPEEIRFITEGN